MASPICLRFLTLLSRRTKSSLGVAEMEGPDRCPRTGSEPCMMTPMVAALSLSMSRRLNAEQILRM